ncbi:MAG: FtsX-like permease family protein, partial [Eubacterium sp.]|nr:FtsX-like permease family protein [Eubacterium sp.]
QRVAIARVLVNDPDILLADEPTGALDSDTSVQVMDLLKEVAKDRLVVMVTHNPELADEYATRIVRLKDGKVISDTDPYVPTSAEIGVPAHRNMGKASMSFLTALSLSLNNLLTKKARTILVAFAGSIGIIGIALILSLSTGVDDYIKNIEEETLAEYPVQIYDTSFNMVSMMETTMGAMRDEEDGKTDADAEDSYGSSDKAGSAASGSGADTGGTRRKPVREIGTVSGMLSGMDSNDLASLKKYIDSENDLFFKYSNAIEYRYDVTPLIYLEDGKKVRQVNPDKTFTSWGIGSGQSGNNMISTMMSTDVFYAIPEDPALYEKQYEVRAGRWPETDHEMVIVLSSRGGVMDTVLYALGMKDYKKLEDAVAEFAEGKDAKLDDELLKLDYEELIGRKLKLVDVSKCYQYDSEYDLYTDKSENQKYMKKVVKDSEDIEIVGIVAPKKDATVTILTPGIWYPSSLKKHVIELAKQSELFEKQKEDPETNVFTGKAFDYDGESDFDMSKLFTVDENAMENAFNFDESALKVDTSALSNINISEKDMRKIMEAAMSGITEKKVNKLITELTNAFRKSVDVEGLMTDAMSGVTDSLGDYMNSPEVQQAFGEFMQAQMAVIMMGGQPDETAMQELMNKLMAGYGEYAQQNPPGEIDTSGIQKAFSKFISSKKARKIIEKNVTKMIDRKKLTKEFSKALQKTMGPAMSKMMGQLADGMQNAFSFDQSAFENAFQVNMTEEDLQELMMSMFATGNATYEQNLKKLGYADLDAPNEIVLYPKNFDSKNELVNIIEEYNERMEKNGEDEKVIGYTDIVGTLMSSVTDIVDAISYVLIAFVAISLVVSSIMIGVITYISVLERKKEIGVLRAIGASKRNISSVFNAETFIIGTLAGLFGIGITRLLLIPGNMIIQSVTNGVNIRAYLPPLAAVILVVLSIVLTLIGGFIPSKKAARSDPVTALRTE